MAIRERYWENRSAGAWHPGQPAEKLTPAGEAYFRTHGELPPDDTRADAESVQGGLKMTTRFDESGRPIREFANTGTRKVWMQPYMSPSYEMLRLTKEAQTPQQNAAWEARRVTAEQLASGNFTLPEF